MIALLDDESKCYTTYTGMTYIGLAAFYFIFQFVFFIYSRRSIRFIIFYRWYTHLCTVYRTVYTVQYVRTRQLLRYGTGTVYYTVVCCTGGGGGVCGGDDPWDRCEHHHM